MTSVHTAFSLLGAPWGVEVDAANGTEWPGAPVACRLLCGGADEPIVARCEQDRQVLMWLAGHPEWLEARIADGSVRLDGTLPLYRVQHPKSTVFADGRMHLGHVAAPVPTPHIMNLAVESPFMQSNTTDAVATFRVTAHVRMALDMPELYRDPHVALRVRIPDLSGHKGRVYCSAEGPPMPVDAKKATDIVLVSGPLCVPLPLCEGQCLAVDCMVTYTHPVTGVQNMRTRHGFRLFLLKDVVENTGCDGASGGIVITDGVWADLQAPATRERYRFGTLHVRACAVADGDDRQLFAAGGGGDCAPPLEWVTTPEHMRYAADYARGRVSARSHPVARRMLEIAEAEARLEDPARFTHPGLGVITSHVFNAPDLEVPLPSAAWPLQQATEPSNPALISVQFTAVLVAHGIHPTAAVRWWHTQVMEKRELLGTTLRLIDAASSLIEAWVRVLPYQADVMLGSGAEKERAVGKEDLGNCRSGPLNDDCDASAGAIARTAADIAAMDPGGDALLGVLIAVLRLHPRFLAIAATNNGSANVAGDGARRGAADGPIEFGGHVTCLGIAAPLVLAMLPPDDPLRQFIDLDAQLRDCEWLQKLPPVIVNEGTGALPHLMGDAPLHWSRQALTQAPLLNMGDYVNELMKALFDRMLPAPTDRAYAQTQHNASVLPSGTTLERSAVVRALNETYAHPLEHTAFHFIAAINALCPMYPEGALAELAEYEDARAPHHRVTLKYSMCTPTPSEGSGGGGGGTIGVWMKDVIQGRFQLQPLTTVSLLDARTMQAAVVATHYINPLIVSARDAMCTPLTASEAVAYMDVPDLADWTGAPWSIPVLLPRRLVTDEAVARLQEALAKVQGHIAVVWDMPGDSWTQHALAWLRQAHVGGLSMRLTPMTMACGVEVTYVSIVFERKV